MRGVLRLFLATTLFLITLTTCGKDSPTTPQPPEPAPPPPPAQVAPAPVATRIEVTPPAATLNAIGQTVQLTARVLDQNNSPMAGASVTWTSSAVGVATVSAGGLVTSVQFGTARITARSGNATAGIEVKVMQSVGSIAIEPDEATIACIGATVKLEATVLDSDGQPIAGAVVTWETSDGDVATVDAQGLVTAVANGTARITARLGDVRQSATVTVEASVPTTERDVLVAFYYRTGGPEWKNNTNWLSSEPLADWYGVSADLGEVGRLELDNNGLKGTIPAELGQLTRVHTLDLSGNQLAGGIPPEFGNMPIIEFLRLNDNPSLSGPMPLEMIELESLRGLYLEGTQLCVPSVLEEWTRSIETAQFSFCAMESPDRDALTIFYHATNGPNWRKRDNWLSDQPLGTWFGVSTDRGERVTALNLSSNRMRGMLPAELGRLTRLEKLDLSHGELTGTIPPEIGKLTELTELNLQHNQLTGSIPPEIGRMRDLVILDLEFNQLNGAIPLEIGQMRSLRYISIWYNQLSNNIPPEIGQLSGLIQLKLNDNQLSGIIPPEIGQLKALQVLNLGDNQLEGKIPPEIMGLSRLKELALYDNQLSGQIPPEVGQLSSIVRLFLGGNQLTGEIPSEIGNLNTLEALWLLNNRLSGSIPRELGQLSRLQDLLLHINNLSGEIPPEIGELTALKNLWLYENQLTGAIPPETGRLGDLIRLLLNNNRLSGSIPPELGKLDVLTLLHLEHNRLSGGIPPEIGEMDELYELKLSYNEDMSGPIPRELMTSATLTNIFVEGTRICAPDNELADTWLRNLEVARVVRCSPPAGSAVYLTQATQSFDYPVPLVTGEDALLRVFVMVDEQADAGMPPVRATFFLDGAEIHTADIAGRETRIPSAIDEGSLSSSANEIIPGSVIAPGLELVVEIDPDGTLDPSLGIRNRIPESDRLSIDVRTPPGLDLTVVPLIWLEDPDHGVVEETEGLTRDDDLFRATRYLLPVRDIEFDVTVREPVYTGVQPVYDNHDRLIREIEAIRVMDGGNGLYMGVLQDGGGATTLGGRSLVAKLNEGVIVHEIGHTFDLLHAPCGALGALDYDYPYRDGSIGAWGYNIFDNEMVPPDTPDLMGYCPDPFWISDYHFRRAMLNRIREAASRQALSGNAASRVLLVWGGVSERDGLVIEPSFVVDAPPYLPGEGGPYRLAGYDGRGNTLFMLNFAMDEIVDEIVDGGSFAYTIPVRSDWPARLSRITLSGPGGDAELTGDGERSTGLLLDQFTGKVRGFLRYNGPESDTSVRYARRAAPDSGLEVVVSPGIPDTKDW